MVGVNGLSPARCKAQTRHGDSDVGLQGGNHPGMFSVEASRSRIVLNRDG